jgi:NADH-quinone oxidoreductase subunit L
VLEVIWLLPAVALFGFAVLLVLGRRIGEPLAGWFATAICGTAFLLAAIAFGQMLSRPAEERSVLSVLYTWLPVGGLHVDMAFRADQLSIAMALFVTGIGALIHLYAIGYMHGDPKFTKFFVYLNLFIFSMLVLVLGSNLVVTFLGWEGVGTCSYLLISFWQTRLTAATAGKKAFITNRVGDVGFMIAMFLTFEAVGSLNYDVLNHAAQGGQLAQSTANGIAALLFVGAVGKSAQLPLYLWLPDAMEGPTPVSALIHAATMVTAGVYLMVRVNPVLHEAHDVLTVIAIIGVATAFFAATIAVAQNDIKRVLAYSTVSQLGYMFLAVGSGAYVAAIFHMITHAFFKALLFLGAGSVIHGMHDEQDMRYMGALRKLLPITASCFIVGWLAIAGVPPFSGFWSKDDILLYAFDFSKILWLFGFITAILTAYYMTRQVMMVFYGEARWTDARPAPVAAHGDESVAAHGDEPADVHGDEHGHAVTPHESPWLMWVPLVVLAVGAFAGGVINLPFAGRDYLHQWLEPVVEGSERTLGATAEDYKWLLLALAGIFALVGIFLGYLVYDRRRLRAIEPAFLANGWYYDQAVTAFTGGPGQAAFEGTATFDAKVVDGAVDGTGKGIRASAQRLRRSESGYVRNYALGIGVGAVLLLGWFVARGLMS